LNTGGLVDGDICIDEDGICGFDRKEGGAGCGDRARVGGAFDDGAEDGGFEFGVGFLGSGAFELGIGDVNSGFESVEVGLVCGKLGAIAFGGFERGVGLGEAGFGGFDFGFGSGADGAKGGEIGFLLSAGGGEICFGGFDFSFLDIEVGDGSGGSGDGVIEVLFGDVPSFVEALGSFFF